MLNVSQIIAFGVRFALQLDLASAERSVHGYPGDQRTVSGLCRFLAHFLHTMFASFLSLIVSMEHISKLQFTIDLTASTI